MSLNKRRGRGAMARAGSNPAVPMWGFQRNSIVFPFSMGQGDHINGSLVELRLRPVYRR